MHDTMVTLKDGNKFVGVLWEYNPRDGFITLTTNDKPIRIYLSDILEATGYGVRVSPTEIKNVDLLERAKKDGWGGKT